MIGRRSMVKEHLELYHNGEFLEHSSSSSSPPPPPIFLVVYRVKNELPEIT